jgi:hypothetical protein
LIVSAGYALPGPRIYIDPSDSIFYSNMTKVGDRFNVTIRVENVTNLGGAQVYLEFDDSIINVTRWFEPKLDPAYVFYGRGTSALPTPPNDVSYGHLGPNKGKVLVSVSLFPPDPPYFSGSGKVCIFELKITAAPPVGGQLTSALHINPTDTFLLDGNGLEIPYATKEDGSYTYIYGSGPPQGVHDVAVLDATVSKTVLGEGYSVVVNIVVGNLGDYAEFFDVTAYANSSVIGMMFGVQLAPNETLGLMLFWNSAEYMKGVYTVSVYASPVPGESNVDNNVRVAGNVLVTIPGDVNGDRKVNLKDIFAIAMAYGSTTGSARYKPNLDVNGDGRIDRKDLLTAFRNFGKQW